MDTNRPYSLDLRRTRSYVYTLVRDAYEENHLDYIRDIQTWVHYSTLRDSDYIPEPVASTFISEMVAAGYYKDRETYFPHSYFQSVCFITKQSCCNVSEIMEMITISMMKLAFEKMDDYKLKDTRSEEDYRH